MFANFFKIVRTRSLDRILAVHHRTIADLKHFADTRADHAMEYRSVAREFDGHADEHEKAATQARIIADKLQQNVMV